MNLMHIESKGINHLYRSKFNVAAYAFDDADVTVAGSNITRPVQNSIRVHEPESKTVDVKSEVLHCKNRFLNITDVFVTIK